MKRFWQLLVLGYLACGVSTTIFAQSLSLGLNFAADDPDAATSSLDATDVAGAFSAANWNNFTGQTGSSVSTLVIDNAGVTSNSTATVSWNSNNTWRSTTGNNSFPAGGNRKLTAGYLDTDNAAAVSMVSVDNIDAAFLSPGYDVLVYFVSDSGANRGGGYTLTPSVGTPIVKYGSTMANPTMHVEDPGTDMDLTLDGTYLKFTGLTAPSFTLTGDATLTTPNGFRAPINGVQIIPTGIMDGDVNVDGSVNDTDFFIISDNLFNTNQTHGQGDLNGDAVTDFIDYRIWKNNAPPAVAASVSLGNGTVPEPTSVLVLAIGAALGALAMRRDVRNAFRSTR